MKLNLIINFYRSSQTKIYERYIAQKNNFVKEFKRKWGLFQNYSQNIKRIIIGTEQGAKYQVISFDLKFIKCNSVTVNYCSSVYTNKGKKL